MIAWCPAIACLFGRAAGGVTLNKEQLAKLRLLRGAVSQLARQGRTGNDFLAHDFLGCLRRFLRLAESPAARWRSPVSGC